MSWSKRARKEWDELAVKVIDLGGFLISEKFKELDSEQQGYLVKQFEYMRGYESMIRLRLMGTEEDTMLDAEKIQKQWDKKMIGYEV